MTAGSLTAGRDHGGESGRGRRERVPFQVIIIYSLLFYAVWTAFELYFKPYLESLDADPVLMQFIKSGLIKNLAWTLPALLLVKKYESCVQIGLKEMFTAKIDWRLTAALLAGTAAYALVPKLIRNGSLEISPEFTVCTLISYLFVGITEESVFRGWLLNATAGDDKRSLILAYAVNGVMFTLIHVPTWYMHGMLGVAIGQFGFLSIIALGTFFGWALLRTRNLLVPVAIHMLYDILFDLFI